MQVIQSIHNNSLSYMIHNSQLQLSILHGTFQSWHHQFNWFNFQRFLLLGRNIKITSNQTSFFESSSKSKTFHEKLRTDFFQGNIPMLCRKVSGIHINEVTDFVFFRFASEFAPFGITENGLFCEAVAHLAYSKPT